jgi:hypothetical protein
MSLEAKMKKDNQSLFGANMESQIRDGEFFTPTRLRNKLKDFILNLDSTATDHSTLSQDYQ